MMKIILPECSKYAGRRIDTCTTIIDLKDTSVMKLFSGDVKRFIQISSRITQDYYPEMMHRMYIVNAGMMFKAVWAMIKPWLDSVTQSKIVIISGDGKKELLQDIPAQNLPVSLGGTFNGYV